MEWQKNTATSKILILPESEKTISPTGAHSFASLDDFGRRFKTDKSSNQHNYLGAYERLLPFQRKDIFTLVEIGVFHGASALMWATWFSNATVVRVDVKPPRPTNPPKNLSLVTGDATRVSTVKRLRARFSPPGVVLDDGSHLWSQQRETFRLLWPWLREGGVYIVEDLHTFSEGGFSGDDLFPFADALLRIATFLQLRDARREQYLAVSPPWFAEILSEIDSITFIESSALIFKKRTVPSK